jgi:hypothetical protein
MKNFVLAYLDPGTGSFILQMLIASLIGIFFFFKNFWRKVRLFITGLFQKEDN